MHIQNLILQKTQENLMKIIDITPYIHLIQAKKTTKKIFGDYQINGLISIAKKFNISSETFIKKITKNFDINYITQSIKIEKSGFINIFLNSQWIEDQINYIFFSPRLGVSLEEPLQTIIVDYSSPNIAKEMHVGHLRSTVIGDSIVRILSFIGHNVIRVNHIGDWGTQFGMLIAYIQKYEHINFLYNEKIQLSTLENYYQKAQKKYNIDPIFAKQSRDCVVKLQQGNSLYQKIWKHLVNITILNNQKIYERLNITLKKSDIMGESLYHCLLPNIVQDLKNKKIAFTSNGATVANINSLQEKDNKNFKVIIQKKDGAYLYSTTDIACIKYRCEILKANRIIYYTDSRQKQHLHQVWEIAKKAGYINQSILLEHHICGILLGKDKKPFTTRSGNSLKLITFLDEALKHTRNFILKKNPNLTHTKINKLAHIISIGAIKYCELSKNRTINYTFNWNNMLKLDGNTAPYIQYAYTRIISILKQSQFSYSQIKQNKIKLHTSEEVSLAIHLLQFEETLTTVAKKGTPHILCAYLYKIAVLFSSIYEKYPILKTTNIKLKYSRIKLLIFTGRTLKKGLYLLGIKKVKYM